MKLSFRPLTLLVALLVVVGLLAMACGSDEEGPAATNPPATGGAGSSPTSGALKLGSAGIANNPRTVRGLEGWSGLTKSLDDGLAVWKTRPANETRTGITSDTIKLGQSAIISGAAATNEACWGPLHQAIIKRINEAGGIHGRKIEFIKRDDGFNPVQTVQVIKALVERDNIFATYFSENTAGHQATRDFLKEHKVLEIAPTDNDLAVLEPPWPYYTGVIYAAPFIGSAVYADYIKQNYPDAKIGIITTDSAYSRNDRDVFKAQAEKLGLKIVADVTVPVSQVDPTSQVQQIVAAGADLMVANLLPIPAPNAMTALRQTIGNKTMKTMKFPAPPSPEFYALYDGNIATTTFATSITSPEMPVWNQLKKLAEEENARYCVGAGSDALVHETEIMVRALEAAGPDLTREGVMEGLQYAFDGYKCTDCFAPIYLSYVDTVAAESFQFYKWDGAQAKATLVGEPVSYETSLGKGVRGNDPRYPCEVPQELSALKLPNYPNTLCPWKKP